MRDIEIFTGPGCSYCDRAKAALREHGLVFVEWDISDGTVLAEFRERLPRVKSLPQIFVEDKHIGGYEDLVIRLKKMSSCGEDIAHEREERMDTVIQWVLELNIKEGKFDAFEALMNEMVAATEANEPNALVYEWFVSDDRRTCHIYERYADSAAVMTHLGNFGEKFAGRFLDALEPTRLTVYGSPGDEARNALAGLNAVFMGEIGGYSR